VTTDPSETGRALARRLALPVYVPMVLILTGRGMLVPILPIYLRESGLSYTMVTVVLAAAGLGAVLGGLPVGAVAGKLGPEVLLVGATLISAAAAALLGASTLVFALVVFQVSAGVGAVGVRVASQMFIISGVPVALRGRGMSMIGGSMRVGMFVGPLIGGLVADLFGFVVAFFACGLVTMTGLVPFLATRRPTDGRRRFEPPTVPLASLSSALRRHFGLLLLAGTGTALVMTVRSGRNVVVPLIGEDLGLSATAVGALVAIGTGADLLLVPVAGLMMDRFGRLYAIVPAFSLLGLGLLILGLTHDATGAIVAGVVMGVGNGMSAGTMLTLGGDLAPIESGPFLSALGMMQDLGVVVGPIIVGWLADSAGLYTSALILAGVMFLAIVWIIVILGDTARPSRPWLVRRLEPNP
jgi:MFS family permease